MLTIRQAIAVEGRYDQNKLAQLVDALIVPLDGFGIFRDQGKLQYLRRLARERGLIILTDPDGAGLVIRNYLRSAIQEGEVTHAYIPPPHAATACPYRPRRPAGAHCAHRPARRALPHHAAVKCLRLLRR